MANISYPQLVHNIGVAIKEKAGLESLKYGEMAQAISDISGGASLNIAYGDTAPEDTSKLWIKANEPSNLEFGYNLENVVENLYMSEAILDKGMFDSSSAVVGNKIYLFGGYYGYYSGGASNAINVFNTETGTVSRLTATLPAAASLIATAVVGNKVYLFGGTQSEKTSGAKLNTINVFDTETETISTLSATLPTAAFAIASAIVGNKIYLFGGHKGTNGSSGYLNTINVFDTETETISTLSATLPTAACAIASTVIGNKVYLFGGDRYNGSLNTINVFDTETKTISTLSVTLPTARGYISAGLVGSSVYLFTGGDLTNSILAFNFEQNTISAITISYSVILYYAITAVVGNKIYLFGGQGESSNIIYNTINIFKLTFPLTNGDIFVQEDFFKNRFDIVSSPTEVSIGVRDVFIGNEDDEAEKAKAYLYDEDTEEWKLI